MHFQHIQMFHWYADCVLCSGGRNLRVKGSVTCLGTVFRVRCVLATLLVGGSRHSYAAPLLNDLILSRVNLFEFSFSCLT